MTEKELDAIMMRLTNARDRKKEIALTKANAEIEAIRREAEAYWDGVYTAMKNHISDSTVSNIRHRLRIKYDKVQPRSKLLPERITRK